MITCVGGSTPGGGAQSILSCALLSGRRGPKHIIITLLLFMILLMSACTKPKQVDPLVQKGKIVYQAKCIVCHNANPALAGAVGPEVKGASLELLKLRIQQGIYPQGYTPKRTTKLMAPMPEISEEEIKALYLYLNSP